MLAGVFDFKSHKMAEDNIHNAYDKSARKHMFFDKIKGYIYCALLKTASILYTTLQVF